jgi:exodeoxyribonuclease-3
LKITTWNVNGYRAVLKKGFLQWVSDYQPDILCLQEIKARPDQIEEEFKKIDGYQAIWNPAERPGYSGVLTFTKIEPQQVSLGLSRPEFDNEGRVIHLRYPSFDLFNVYFPNGQRGHDRVEYKLDFYAELLKQCDELHHAGKNVIITGDFNTAHREIDLANPKENANTSGFLPEERVWIDYYLEHNLVDVYRLLYPERVQYTWWTYRFGARGRNIGWRLDYFLTSKPVAEMTRDVIIHDEIQGSDHCPVSLILQ